MAVQPTTPVSGYFGLGDLLADQVNNETEELRRRRQAQLAGRPVSAGLGYGLTAIGGPASTAFGNTGGLAG